MSVRPRIDHIEGQLVALVPDYRRYAGDEPAVPGPVTGLAAGAVSETSVRLSWFDPPASVDAYELEGLPGLLASDASEYVVASLPKGLYVPPRIRRFGRVGSGPWASFPPVEVTGPSGPASPGAYPGPPQGAVAVDANVDLSSLAPGIYAMRDGARRDLVGLKPGVSVWCEHHLGVKVDTPLGKRVAVLLNNTIAGFDVTGGGLDRKHNDKQGIAVGDDSSVRWIRYRDSLGVAVAFGVGSESGSRVGVFHCEFYNCGSASIGGKGRDAEVAFNLCVDGNKTVKDADGAGMGKFNRCRNLKIHDNTIRNGHHTLIWFDIRNSGTEVVDNVLDGCARLGKSYEGRGVVHEIGNRPGDELPHVVTGNTFKNLYGPSVCVEETQNVTVSGNTFFRGVGPEAAELHVRQLDRNDPDASVWKLRKLKASGNRRGEQGQTELLVTRSQSGEQFSVATLTGAYGCVFQPEVKFRF